MRVITLSNSTSRVKITIVSLMTRFSANSTSTLFARLRGRLGRIEVGMEMEERRVLRVDVEGRCRAFRMRIALHESGSFRLAF